MAQPPPYAPVTSFITYQAQQAWFPGQNLDVEFNAIDTSINAIRFDLALIQNDDGTLGNGIVDWAQLSGSIQTQLKAQGFVPPSPAGLGTFTSMNVWPTSLQANAVAALAVYGPTSAVYNEGAVNGFVSYLVNNSPVQAIFPTAVTGIGYLQNPGSQIFGFFGGVHIQAAGVGTNEFDTFNTFGAPSTALPPDRSFGIATALPITLTLGAGGTFQSAIALEIGQEGSAPNSYLAGIYTGPGAITSYGIFIDATNTASVNTPTTGFGPNTGMVIRNHGQGAGQNLILQTVGTEQVSNSVMLVENSAGVVRFGLYQSGAVQAGGGTPFTISAGDPSVGLSSQFFPPAARTTSDPVIALQRDVSYSTGATASPTLSILTRAAFTASTAWANGILSEIILNSSTNDTAYVEAIRGVGSIGSAVTTHNSCWGGLFNAQALNTAAYSTVQAVEAGVYQATGSDAAAPSATPLSKWAVSYVASLGVTVTAQNLVDAAYMVNPFSTSGAQVAFFVPVEAAGTNGNGVTRVGNIIKYAAFAAANSSTYGIDIHLGTWATAAIWLPNNKVIQAQNAANNAAIALISLDASNRIALGVSGTAAASVIIWNSTAVATATGATQLTISPQTASQNAVLAFQDANATKWSFGKDTSNNFALTDSTRGAIDLSIVANGNMTLMGNGGGVGIGTAGISTSFLALAAGTTGVAQMNFASSTAPTSPNNGDFWFDSGTSVKIRIGGVTKTFTVT